MTRTLLGGITPRAFLARYWQKRPLLVRGARPDFRDPFTPAELAELACETDVESRLVLERGGSHPWQVVDGPQEPRRLRRLPATHWTLLVQEANRHVPELAKLLEAFAFIPSWRVDDVMVSFAPRGGSVGPHVDSYDVFLLQGRGRRRWQIDPEAQAELRPGLDLRILRGFRARETWLLEPGDMLYLPPGLAHFGVALEDCFTYSIGFRAPSHAELVLAYLQRTLARIEPGLRYSDPDLRPARHAGEIGASALRRMGEILRRELAARPRALAQALGELLTEPKASLREPSRSRVTSEALRARLLRSGGLLRVGASRIAFVREAGGRALLFADGRCYPLPRSLGFAAPLLADRRSLPGAALLPHLRNRAFRELLASLVNAGCFRFVRSPRASA